MFNGEILNDPRVLTLHIIDSMSTPKGSTTSSSTSPLFQSGQHQANEELITEESVETSSPKQSPQSQAGFQNVRATIPRVAVDSESDTDSSDRHTLRRQARQEKDQLRYTPSLGNNLIVDNSPRPLRPNKYHGPPSTWRNWTAAERDLAASLEQLTANDLSVHLYNAFHLKNRPDRSRERWVEHRGEDVEGTEAWVPPKVWTAWPLPPDLVPREGEVPRWEEEGQRSRRYLEKNTASRLLKEILVGHVLKKAKERFKTRQLEDDQLHEVDRKRERKSSEQHKTSQDDLAVYDVFSPDRKDDDGRAESVLSSSGKADDDEDSEKAQNSEADSQTSSTTKPSDGYIDQPSNDFEPEIMVDDEKATNILEPTLNHILIKLDTLLMGLHHARNAYAVVDGSASEFYKDVGQAQPSRHGKKEQRSPRHQASRARSQDQSSAGFDNDTGQDRKPSSTGRKRSQRAPSLRRKSKPRLGLRDWSDVLGVASMTGWKPAAVEDAVIRCTALFDEGITLRTLSESNARFEEILYTAGNSKHVRIEKGSVLD